MNDKLVGASVFNGGVKKRTKAIVSREAEKRPVYVAELGMSLYLLPGADIAAVVARYREAREFARGTVKGNKKY